MNITPCQTCQKPGKLFETDRCWWVVQCEGCGSRGPRQNIFEHDGRLGIKLRLFKEAHAGLTPGGYKTVEAWNAMQRRLAHGILLEDSGMELGPSKSARRL